MRRWFFALIAICFSAPLHADEPAHPGIMLDTAPLDIGGDGYIFPIRWCGELLWIDADHGQRLIDPSTARVLWSRSSEEAAVLVTCTGEPNQPTLWLDRLGQGIVEWYSSKDGRSGRIEGVAITDAIYSKPAFAAGDAVIVAIPEPGRTIRASALPPDVRLVPVGLKTIPKVAEPGNIVELQVWRNRWLIAATDTWDASRAADRLDLSLVDLRTGIAEFKRNWSLDAVIGGTVNRALCCYFEDRSDGALGFLLIAGANAYACRLSDSNPEIPDLQCARSDRELKDSLASDEDGVRERLAGTVPGGSDYSLSPSGRWVAWLFNPDLNDLQGHDTIYVAPTADLLMP